MSEHKAIFKSASAIGAITILSRITGFVRDVLIATVFGTGVAAQAFFVASKIPNAFRDIIGEGAGNAAFVPVFCEYLSKGRREDFLRLVNSVLRLLLVISGVIALAGIIFAPFIVRLIAPGFLEDRVKFDMTVHLTRLLFPFLILVSLSAYLMSVSNALKSFVLPAFSQVVSNLVLIVLIYLIANTAGLNRIYALGVAVLVAGSAQVMMQLPQMVKMGVDFRRGGVYPRIFKEEVIHKIGRLIMPRLVGTSIYQLNVFVDAIFGSLAYFVGEGAIAAIYYANRIIQFPFAVFGIALSNAALPTMSSDSASKDMGKFKATLLFCLKSVFLGVIPLMTGILIFSFPLVMVIFQRGSFDAYSTDITSRAVFFYGLGLLSYIGVRFLSHGFYALQDTATPVKTASIALVSNIILNSLFVFILRMQISGLALASSISATLNFYMLYNIMKKRTGFAFDRAFGRLILKSVAASLAMAVVVFWVWHRWFAGHPTLIRMLAVVLLGGVSYGLFLKLLKVDEVDRLLTWLRKKR